SELHSWFASHMDVNAILYGNQEPKIIKSIQENATKNLKRVVHYATSAWEKDESQNPYRILDFQEIKTTWHPIGI
ncbi:MAG: aldehyde dehydrogenase, partial [Bacteroidetes bacterium]|nr:aldehyde dehydrogenase [Bacteroidota bacterium]